jgi:hypothetical protein
MKAHLDEAATAASILRKDAKVAIVRNMRADGLKVTPHAERQILAAKTIEDAQALEQMARSMSSEPVEGAQSAKGKSAPPADRSALAGLSAYQRQQYAGHARKDPAKAAAFVKQCAATNARRAGKAV